MTPQQHTNITEQSSSADKEPLSFDETVKRALAFCRTLPEDFAQYRAQLMELQTRLSKGRLHFAVLGQFNRGKSTFINALLRIKSLPTSVLPLTSVPTVIEYGAQESCRIRFLDEREDLVIRESPEEMELTLRKYVAEENNPKNKYKVKDAAISCPSGLLSNGTILIDTPGFGSTHLHNTQTTLDLLIECDAALFLLSADPPMTQTEKEFLRMVKDRVPKLFFVLNKVDLLHGEELEEVCAFIQNILTNDLGFVGGANLYRTCAVKGIRAKADDPKDQDWAESGLEAVKKEVLDFMVREKYFTLSEALSDKYNEAMTAAKALLEKKLADILAPLAAAKEDIAAVIAAIQAVSLEQESQVKKAADEKEALGQKINALTNDNIESYTMSVKKALDILLGDRYFPAEAASIASTMLPKHTNDLGAKIFGSIIGSANTSIRALTINHAAALANLKKRYAEYLSEKIKYPSAEELASKLEIKMPNTDNIFGGDPFPMPEPKIMDIFRKKTVRFNAIREFYEPLCVDSIAKNMAAATEQTRTLTDAAWDTAKDTIQNAYQTMIDQMKEAWRVKQDKLDADEAAVKEEVNFLREKVKEVSFYV